MPPLRGPGVTSLPMGGLEVEEPEPPAELCCGCFKVLQQEKLCFNECFSFHGIEKS